MFKWIKSLFTASATEVAETEAPAPVTTKVDFDLASPAVESRPVPLVPPPVPRGAVEKAVEPVEAAEKPAKKSKPKAKNHNTSKKTAETAPAAKADKKPAAKGPRHTNPKKK